jgi:tripartite-type tricarboxylate transporter receptor subunit TctC
MMKAVLAAAAAVIALGTAPTTQAAWPEKPIKVVVPFQAGGTSDQVTRAFQAAIQENDILPQPITIINVGGHYSIGSRRVLEAAPDGYEFLTIHVALMGGEGAGVLDFSWRDFTPVAATGQFCVAHQPENGRMRWVVEIRDFLIHTIHGQGVLDEVI